MKEVFINESGAFVPVEKSNKTLCGFYAAVGFNGATAGDLFAVVSGPVLVPCFDGNGARINVGAEHAGQSYDRRRGIWYNE